VNIIFFQENKHGRFLKFILPLLIWAYLYRDILLAWAPVFPETFYIYSIVRFVLDNLRVGVFPLWNPYLLWGVPVQIFLTYIGIFNPVWWGMFFLQLAGVDSYQAFIGVAFLYFLLGQFGVYGLARAVLKDRRAAYGAFLLSLFSSAGMTVGVQYHMVLLFVPVVWLAFFLCRFYQKGTVRYALGAVFFSILILTTYLPLYALVVFLGAGLALLLTAPSVVLNYGRRCRSFALRNRLFSAGMILAVLFSTLPGLLAYNSIQRKEVVVPFRHQGHQVFNQGLAYPDYAAFTDGALAARMSLRDFYADLNELNYGNEGILYLGNWAFLVLLLSLPNRVTRRGLFFAVLSLFLSLLTLEKATPVHKFLFQHVFIFRLIRNMHFFNPFLLTAFILLVSEQFRNLLWEGLDLPSRHWRVAYIFLIHMAAGLFLLWQSVIHTTTLIVILLSLVFWIRRTVEKAGEVLSPVAWALLVGGVLFQPLEVIGHYQHNAGSVWPLIRDHARIPTRHPTFSFVRPLRPLFHGSPEEEHVLTAIYRIRMEDSPGFFMRWQNAFPCYWSYFLATYIPEPEFRPLSQHKFILYDRVKVLDESLPLVRKSPAGDILPAVSGVTSVFEISSLFMEMREAFRWRQNVAFVHASLRDISPSVRVMASRGGDGDPLFVEGTSSQARLKKYTVNGLTLETDLPTDKFLVFTDSFHPGWRAALDGRPVPLYRANLAFKGLVVPAGRHEIEFSFSPSFMRIVFLFQEVIVMGILVAGGAVFYRSKRYGAYAGPSPKAVCR